MASNLERWAPMYRKRSGMEEAGDLISNLGSLYQMLLIQRQHQLQKWEVEQKISIEREKLQLEDRRTASQETVDRALVGKHGAESRHFDRQGQLITAQANSYNAQANLNKAQTDLANVQTRNALYEGFIAPIMKMSDSDTKAVESLLAVSAHTQNEIAMAGRGLYDFHLKVSKKEDKTTLDREGNIVYDYNTLSNATVVNPQLKKIGEWGVNAGLWTTSAGLFPYAKEKVGVYLSTKEGQQWLADHGDNPAHSAVTQMVTEVFASSLSKEAKAGLKIPHIGTAGAEELKAANPLRNDAWGSGYSWIQAGRGYVRSGEISSRSDDLIRRMTANISVSNYVRGELIKHGHNTTPEQMDEILMNAYLYRQQLELTPPAVSGEVSRQLIEEGKKSWWETKRKDIGEIEKVPGTILYPWPHKPGLR